MAQLGGQLGSLHGEPSVQLLGSGVYITALDPDEGETTVEMFTQVALHPDAPQKRSMGSTNKARMAERSCVNPAGPWEI